MVTVRQRPRIGWSPLGCDVIGPVPSNQLVAMASPTTAKHAVRTIGEKFRAQHQMQRLPGHAHMRGYAFRAENDFALPVGEYGAEKNRCI